MQRNGFYGLLATNKAKHIYSIGIFHAPVVTQFRLKYKENSKKVPFLKLYHFSISQHFFECNGVSRASSYHIIHYNKRAQYLSGRVLDLRQRGRGFQHHWRHCVVVLETHLS